MFELLGGGLLGSIFGGLFRLAPISHGTSTLILVSGWLLYLRQRGSTCGTRQLFLGYQ